MPPPRELDIDGMTCAACVGRVERVLKRVPGVRDAAVNLATHRATVTADAVPDAALIAAVEKAGYSARPHVPAFTADDLAPDARGDRRPRPRDLGPVRWVPSPAAMRGA